VRDGEASKLVVHVDSGSPLAWKNEPYYSQVKGWARQLLEQNGMVNIYVQNRVIVVLPTKDVDLGRFELGDKFSIRKKRTANGWEYDAYKVPRQESPAE
jgi:serine protease inhibitor ecotin